MFLKEIEAFRDKYTQEKALNLSALKVKLDELQIFDEKMKNYLALHSDLNQLIPNRTESWQ